MKSFKKILVFSLVLCMITFVLAGCGKDSSVKDPQGKKSGTIEKQDSFSKYDTSITITSVRALPDAAIIKAYPQGDDIQNNVWTRTIKDELGIDVQYMWTADVSQLSTRLNAMIASRSMPDFFLATPAQFKDLKDAGELMDLTNAYNNYSSDTLKSVIKEAGPDLLASAQQDGKLMAIPVTTAKEFGPMIWIREDWRKNLNLPEPKTFDDIMNMAEAFATKDPDKNEKKDTFGIPINGDLTGGLVIHAGFFNCLNSYPTIWVKDSSGNLAYGSTTKETKIALGKLHDLYTKGAIDPEFITRDFSKTYAPIQAGQYGIVFGPYYFSISPLDDTTQKGAEWKAYPLLAQDGSLAKMQQTVPLSGYYIVNKNCKNPEAIIKLANFYLREFYESPSAERFKKMINDGAAQTSIYSATPIQLFKAWSNTEANLLVKDIIDGSKKVTDITDANALSTYDNIEKFKAGDKKLTFYQTKYDAMINILAEYKAKNLIQSNMNLSSPGDAYSAKYANLYKTEQETFDKIITGAIPLDDFDKWVATWKSTGGDEINKEINDWYATVKK